jgi:hypothetical protein
MGVKLLLFLSQEDDRDGLSRGNIVSRCPIFVPDTIEILLRQAASSAIVGCVRTFGRFWQIGSMRGQSERKNYCSFAYSALASCRMGMSGSASFHRVKKSWYAALAFVLSPESV